MSLTIKDIASMANVSHATVSRVLNNSPKVKAKTREMVLKVIEEVGFSPRMSARALNSGKNYNIGLLILYNVFQSQFPAEFLPGILAGITGQLHGTGYMLSLFLDQTADHFADDALINRNLDGLIVIGLETNTRLAYRISRITLPVVLLNLHFDDLTIPSVTTDDEQGAYLATSHLIGMGHRRIAFMEGDPRYHTSNSRRRGFLAAMAEHDVPAPAALMRTGNYDEGCAYQETRALLEGGEPFTAMFCSNDIMALGVIQALRSKGLRVPEDVSLVGFDDTQFATAIDPPLTTVRKPRTHMGAEAARMLLDILEGEADASNRRIVLENRLITRQSVCPPKSAG